MEGQDGALSGITAENGGNVYGGNGFEKDRRGAAYHTEMDMQAVLMLLKLVLGMAKLFLLLLALVARVVLTMVGGVAGRR